MPIHLAGSEIKRILGFEPTGRDFTEFTILEDKDEVWRRRYQYFAVPCGFYEVSEVSTQGLGRFYFATTMFPIFGEKRDPRLMVYIEAQKPSIEPKEQTPSELVVANAIVRFPIDIGAGVPPGFDE